MSGTHRSVCMSHVYWVHIVLFVCPMFVGYTIIVLLVFVSAADPCQPNPCEHGGECHHFGGGYVCQCEVQCTCAYHDVGANCEHVRGNYEPF